MVRVGGVVVDSKRNGRVDGSRFEGRVFADVVHGLASLSPSSLDHHNRNVGTMSNDKVRVRVCSFHILSTEISADLLGDIQGISIFRPIIYGNTATLLTQEERKGGTIAPDHTHRWTVAVRSAASVPDSDIVGGADDLSYFIKRVTFKLHDTYTNPTRSE